MNAKAELLSKLNTMFPGNESVILAIVSPYCVSKQLNDECEISISYYVDQFIEAKRINNLSERTLSDYNTTLKAFAKQVDLTIAEVDTPDVRRYLNYLSKTKHVKQSSIKTYTNILRSFFNWLIGEGVLHDNPMRKIKQKSVESTKQRQPLSADEFATITETCDCERDKAMIEFIASTGCRISEVVQLDVDDINWTDRSAVVVGKGNKVRKVYFSEHSEHLLKHYINCRPASKPLFTTMTKPYNRISSEAVEDRFKQLGDRCKLNRRFHPHLLRHTFASNALNAGMDIAVLQSLLGHNDPKTTMIYAKMNDLTVKKQYDAVMNA